MTGLAIHQHMQPTHGSPSDPNWPRPRQALCCCRSCNAACTAPTWPLPCGPAAASAVARRGPRRRPRPRGCQSLIWTCPHSSLHMSTILHGGNSAAGGGGAIIASQQASGIHINSNIAPSREKQCRRGPHHWRSGARGCVCSICCHNHQASTHPATALSNNELGLCMVRGMFW
jgi:hypothetical protein